MFGYEYYHSSIKKATVLFGTLFNDITIVRTNTDGSEEKTLPVALEYGPREKAMARVENDPNLNRVYAQYFPRMSFEITDIQYDGDRALPTTQRVASRVKTADNKSVYRDAFMPVPYNIIFNLYITSKSTNDANRIVEQILPFFTPDWTLSANLVDELPDRTWDIPIILKSVNMDDAYESDFKTRRAIVWTLSFQMKTWFFGPINKAKVIKFSRVNFITGNWGEANLAVTANGTIDASNAYSAGLYYSNTVSEYLTVQPGLTANGQPTTIAANSIPYTDIEETDPYGYIVTISDT